ncbi:hypothetical protein FD754_010099, partial [Muntiacus muntjak]
EGGLADVVEATSLSSGTRIKGFIACFAIGILCSLLGTLLLWVPRKGLYLFAVFYTFGNIASLGRLNLYFPQMFLFFVGTVSLPGVPAHFHPIFDGYLLICQYLTQKKHDLQLALALAVLVFFPLKSIDFYPFLFHLHLQPNECFSLPWAMLFPWTIPSFQTILSGLLL